MEEYQVGQHYIILCDIHIFTEVDDVGADISVCELDSFGIFFTSAGEQDRYIVILCTLVDGIEDHLNRQFRS